MKTNIFAVILGVVALVVSGVAYTKEPSVVTQVEKQVYGGVNPDIPSPYISFGNLPFYAAHPAMVTATTSLCSMQSPSSTSTLESVSWQVTVGTGTAATIDIGTSTNAFSTTTNLVAATSLGANATGNAIWSSGGATAQDAIMAPSTWVNVKTAGAGLGGYTYGGTCTAVFKVL